MLNVGTNNAKEQFKDQLERIMTKNISRILGTIVILANLGFFIPLTIETLLSGGGSFGYGLLLLPISIITHVLLIPAVLTWTNRTDKYKGFLVTNLLSTIWSIFWVALFITATESKNEEITKPNGEIESSIILTTQNLTDKNFNLIEDFEKTKNTFRQDTFDLNLQSTEGGQLIVFHTADKDYLVLDIKLFGETGKIHATYWTDRELNIKIAKWTDFDYDKPYYENDYKISETTEFYSFLDNSFMRYNSDKQEIKKSDNSEIEMEIKNFFVDITKDIEIIK